MTKRPPPIMPQAPRQLSIGFDPSRLQEMVPSERAKVLALLVDLLMQAANATAEKSSDEHQ